MSEVAKYFFAVSIMVEEMFSISEDLSGLMKMSMGGGLAVSSSTLLLSSFSIALLGKRHSREFIPALMAVLCVEEITLKAASISSDEASASGPVIGVSSGIGSKPVGHTFILNELPHFCFESPGQSMEHSELQVMVFGWESPQ